MQEVDGSSPFVPTKIRGYSTVGSAIRSQRIGQGFESPYLHQKDMSQYIVAYLCFYTIYCMFLFYGTNQEQYVAKNRRANVAQFHIRSAVSILSIKFHAKNFRSWSFPRTI